MNELFNRFGKDEEEEEGSPKMPMKKKTGVGMEKPEGKDPVADRLVERMAGASASAGRAAAKRKAKAKGKDKGKNPFKKKEEEE